MPRTLFVLLLFVVLLFTLMMPAKAVAGPPDEGTGEMVVDEVTTLRAEVQRLEKEVTNDEYKANDLAVARARLLAAEGRTTAACNAWRKIIASREEEMKRRQLLALDGKICTPFNPAILRGPVAEARCGLAEVERDRAVLARELPKVIDYHKAYLGMLNELRQRGAYPDEETEEERTTRKALRKARLRLDAVK